MTDALHDALQAHRHLRAPYVLAQDAGTLVPGHILRDWLEAAQRRAGLPVPEPFTSSVTRSVATWP